MQLQLPSAALSFSAQAKTGADRTIYKLQLSQEWRVQSDLFDIRAVHAKLGTPSLQALTGKHVGVSLLGHSCLVALCSLVLSQEGQ